MGFIVRWLRLMPLAGLALLAPAQERGAAAPILERLERNMSFRTAYVEAEVVITAKNRVSAKTFFAYLEGTERTWVEYVSPARDRGLRVLRTADDLRVYLPSARKVMKIRNGRRQRRGYADFPLTMSLNWPSTCADSSLATNWLPRCSPAGPAISSAWSPRFPDGPIPCARCGWTRRPPCACASSSLRAAARWPGN